MATVRSLKASLPYTQADLEFTPEDGRRYEIIDGTLVVTPASRPTAHQRALMELLVMLDQASPPDLKVLPGPLAVVLADDTVLVPDIIVARKASFTDEHLSGTPVLLVEVLSTETRRFDLLLKRDRLQSAGCPHYWIIDPDEPSLMALDLKDGVYHQAGFVTGDEIYRATLPYAVSVVPANLVSA